MIDLSIAEILKLVMKKKNSIPEELEDPGSFNSPEPDKINTIFKKSDQF